MILLDGDTLTLGQLTAVADAGAPVPLAPDVAAALSIDGLHGSRHPFEARIHEARPFQGQLASAANLAALLATIAERRVARLVDPAASGLPAFLTRDSGLNSGLMMAQVTAAALVSEIKTLAHPASVDTIPTSAGREDHVSMSMGVALKAARAVDLARRVTAVEMLCACQALDLLAPLAPSAALARVHARVRDIVPTLDTDRVLSGDIEAIAATIASGTVEHACAMEVKEKFGIDNVRVRS